ncbi:ion channel protein [Cellulomonas alba]|uniref:Ion channel protein n=1 Tax=Cellulomonas alba TaxID=3053467 RepID=A0ABT7SGB4_9CELL|nr:ion channel protein [Cellulomonas alba]MDM7855235.1 ion channel protein [Cellulomonas alba]
MTQQEEPGVEPGPVPVAPTAPDAAPAPGPGPTGEFHVPVRRLLKLTVPAVVVGVGCALTLWGLSSLAGALEHVLWDDLSGVFGLTKDSRLWIAIMLVLTAVLVGLVVTYAPGHAGPDPATTGLVEKPLAMRVLPGLAVALVLMLAGGVSLGPENPIMAINAALVTVFGARVARGTPAMLWISLSTAATIGAMFGTPVAAALMFSELDLGDRRIPLWDRLFAPLVAATAGALTMSQVASDLSMQLDLPQYTDLRFRDLGFAVVIALATAALGLLGAYVFTPLHRAFRRTGRPLVAIVLGGVVLAGLGALGGSITLFKGLEQMKQLPGLADAHGAGWFFGIALVKLAALLVASASGFRGGRIFPATFAGAAIGFGIHAWLPGVPVSLAVACSVVGIVVAATRSGWLSLFLGVALVPDTLLLMPCLLATLAAWLLVTNRPELRATDTDAPGPAGTPAPASVSDAGQAPPPSQDR